MEDKKAKIIAASTIITLITCLIIARTTLGLSNAFYLLTGADVAAILAVITFFLLRKRYNNNNETSLESQTVSELRIEYSFLRRVGGVPTKFRYGDIELATDEFKYLLGQGASGSVFKGILDDGTPVAVKRIEGRGERQFRSEVAAVASVQHVNLVRLLGYCCAPSSGPWFLIYDFVPNGSLDKWIFPPCEKELSSRGGRIQHIGGCLEWRSRVRVAVDVAKALSYLHHDCRSKILHFDVKPENILLDENYRAFVTDFGLSKLMGIDESRVLTRFRGTKGYLAPEWVLQQGVSEKCDVFSFGIVLLEIVGGTRSIIRNEHSAEKMERKSNKYFPKIVFEKLREGRVMEVVDKRVVEKGGVDEREVKRLVCVGLWCIQEQAKMRPSMSRVVEMLEGRAPVEEPPETEMMIIKFLSSYEKEISSGHDSRWIPLSPVTQGNNGGCSFTSCSTYLSILSGR